MVLFYPSSSQEDESGLQPLPSQGDKRGSLARTTVPQGHQGGGRGLAPGPAQVHSEKKAWLTFWPVIAALVSLLWVPYAWGCLFACQRQD